VRFDTLQAWLDWQETFHPKAIDPGLERVGEVAKRLRLLSPDYHIITVAGTNGKGSSVAFLEAISIAAGLKVGCYTSPHLQQYNERIRLQGELASDQLIMQAFDAIDQGRGEISLSYFEFGTLAALWLFRKMAVDVAVLEVGLGGRLDAVNILDADIALVSNIAMDHMEWLGNDLQQIAREKAGIARAGKPLISSDPQAAPALETAALAKGALFVKAGHDYRYTVNEVGWFWEMGAVRYENLPPPALQGMHQYQNAAGALAALQLLPSRLRPNYQAVVEGLKNARLPGRWEILRTQPLIIADVAHNPDSAAALSANLRRNVVAGKTLLIFGIMKDKDLAGMAIQLMPVVDRWLVSAADIVRAMPAEELRDRLLEISPDADVTAYPDLEQAFLSAKAMMTDQDRLIIAGSFYTVAEVRALLV
jgi:dihydrofolate synthase/folylpolyglutamate synthase